MMPLARIALAFLFVAQLSLSCFAQSGIITTVAGNGIPGFSGDGGPASAAKLSLPGGVAVDSAGNLFFSDINNNRVRMVTSGGVISTVAGNGSQGFSGDGGSASSAQLNNQTGIAVDSSGDLFIADINNNRVRKVTPAGVINTVAGNGTPGFSGDGGPASSAQLSSPTGVAVDSEGNLFITDKSNNRIRKVTPAGVINTVAGNGSKGFSGDGGPASSASLSFPHSLTVDSAGNLFFTDLQNNRVRKVTPAGIISTVAGNGTPGFSGDGGPASAASLSYPTGIAVDSAGNLFIADQGNQRIRKVTSGGVISSAAGNGTQGFSGDGGPASAAQVNSPTGVAVDSEGNLFFADFYNNRIRKVTAISSSVIFFPHVAVGGSWSTSFTLSNTSANTISGNLIITDYQGNPFTVNSSSLGIGSSFAISIPSGGTVFLTANSLSPNDPAKNGWAKVETLGGSLNGVATFQSASQGVIQTAAGVLSSQPTQFATIPVDENDSLSRATAYGVANPTNQIVVVKLALVDSNGVLVDDTVSITLNPGQQMPRYLNQDFKRSTFQGSLVLRAQGGGTFVVVALIQNQQLFTAIPVTPKKAPNIPN
jgi:sugar lactone lactonase YvrE